MAEPLPRGKILTQRWITRSDVRKGRAKLFVFGDNMSGRGYGGQAGAMRGEPNAVGVVTKWYPSRQPAAYFKDSDWDNPDVRHALFQAFERLERHLAAGRDIVLPEDGVGTGMAMLHERAPKIDAYITQQLAYLAREAGND